MQPLVNVVNDTSHEGIGMHHLRRALSLARWYKYAASGQKYKRYPGSLRWTFFVGTAVGWPVFAESVALCRTAGSHSRLRHTALL